jgi:hypothetical protein
MNDDTHGRDVPVPALVYDIPKAVTSYRASARGAGTAEVREADETAQPFTPAFHQVAAKTTAFLPQSQSKFVDALGGTCENLSGGRTVRSTEKRKAR